MWLESFQEEKTETQKGVYHVTTQGAPPEGRGHVEKEIEPSGTSPRAKEHLGPPEAGRGTEGPCPGVAEEECSAGPLISDFQPAELRENDQPCGWDFAGAARGNQPSLFRGASRHQPGLFPAPLHR